MQQQTPKTRLNFEGEKQLFAPSTLNVVSFFFLIYITKCVCGENIEPNFYCQRIHKAEESRRLTSGDLFSCFFVVKMLREKRLATSLP
jgi:hypothetical protein